MSFESCMQKKIIDHYGPKVEQCIKAITKGDYTSIIECIATVLAITDPETWIPEQVVLFAEWALECEL